MTQDSKARTSVLFRKIMSNLKPFFSGRHEGSTKRHFGGVCGVWFMGDFVGDGKNSRKIDSKKVE